MCTPIPVWVCDQPQSHTSQTHAHAPHARTARTHMRTEHTHAHTGSTFGSSCELLESALLDQVVTDSGIVEAVLEAAKRRQVAELNKQAAPSGSRFRGLKIPKLDDAHLAGTDRASECTLILTEGDSAKALAGNLGLEWVHLSKAAGSHVPRKHMPLFLVKSCTSPTDVDWSPT